MAKPEYKFKPYSPVNLKMASPKGASLNKERDTFNSLQKQKENLEKRLLAEGVDPSTLGGAFDNRNLIEKALNLKPNQGLLMDFFEVINRPVEAVKAGIVAGIDGENVIESALEGLSGKKVTEGSEIFTKVTGIEPESKVGKFIVNVGTDIVLDPLTYLPAGFFTKRIGKLFAKSKDIIVKDFVGEGLEQLAKVGVKGADGLAFKNWDDLGVYVRSLDDTKKADVIKTIKDTINDPKNSSIFRKGSAEDYVNGDYIKSFEGLKARRQFLKETHAKVLNIRKTTADPGEADKAIAQLLKERGLTKYSKTGLDNGVLAELKLADEISPKLVDLGPDFDVMVTSTSNRLDDVSIVRKVNIGDEEFYVKIATFDAKQSAGAFGATRSIKIDKDTGEPIFSGDFLKADQTLKDLKNVKISYTTPDGKTIDNLFDAITDLGKRSRGPRGTNSINPYSLLAKGDTAGKEALDNYFKAINRAKFDNGKGFIYLSDAAGEGKGIFIRYEDAEKYLDFSKTSFSRGAAGTPKKTLLIQELEAIGKITADEGKKLSVKELTELATQNGIDLSKTKGTDFRMSTKMGLDSDAYKRLVAETPSNKILDSNNLIEDLSTKTTKTIKIGFLDWLEDKDGWIGDLARVTNRALKTLKAKFSLYGFLPDEVETAVRRMSGETAIQYQTRMQRLAALQDSFEKAFPGQSKTLAQLVEMGASLDEAGQLVLAPRTIGLQDYFQHMLNASDNGHPIQLRRFANKQAESRFLSVLEDATGNQNSFEIITKKNGTQVLTTNLTSQELREALEIVKIDSRYKDLILDFGKANPTPEQLKILKEWQGFDEFVTLKNDVQKLLVQEGGFTEFLGSELSDTYVRHIITKDAYEYLQKNQPGILSKYAKPGSNRFADRKYIGTIDEVNEYLQAIYDLPIDVIDNNVFRATEDFFKVAFRNIEQGKMVDILLSSKDKYGRSLMRVVDNTRPIRDSLSPDDIMFKSFQEEFRPLFKNLSEDAQKGMIDYLTRNGFADGKAVVMNRSMHSVLKRVEAAFVDLPSWVKIYDKYLNTWKGLTLVTPGFHLRNLFGNSFNSYAVGMDTFSQLRYARIAALEFNQYDEAMKILANGGTLTAKQQKVVDVMNEFQRSGLIQSHRGVRDLEQVKEATAEALKNKTGSKFIQGYNKAVRFNFNVAEKMDDMQRYMLFRWSFDKTGDAVQASKTVAKSLFDYSNLTSFEKDVMKRLFPFYTFMKNNFIFQAKNIFQNPAQYAKVGRAYKYYLEDIAGYSPEDLPDYAVNNMWIPIPMMITKNDKEGIAFLKANLPIGDFTELVSNPFAKGVTSITVPIKLAIELGAGRDLFTGAPLQEFPGQTNVMEQGTGFLSGLRDQRGTLAIAQTPLMQKVLNDLGLRTPFNAASIGLDVIDTLLGYQGGSEGIGDFLQRTGIAGVQEVENIKLTTLYQDLEKLRELKKYYEQETGNQLPVLPRG